MATLNEKQAALFTDRNWGVIATIREDGSPQATPVWIDYDGENVLVNSARGRTKVNNIERDPRATVTVLPAEDQQSGYVMVSGPAEITEEGALEHINMLAKKYLARQIHLSRPGRAACNHPDPPRTQRRLRRRRLSPPLATPTAPPGTERSGVIPEHWPKPA